MASSAHQSGAFTTLVGGALGASHRHMGEPGAIGARRSTRGAARWWISNPGGPGVGARAGHARHALPGAIEVRTLSEAEWGRVIEALASRALYAAQLLNGEMPQDVEGAFQSAGVSLFPIAPRPAAAMHLPRPVKPCKQCGGVLSLGERFDEDPLACSCCAGAPASRSCGAARAPRQPAAVSLRPRRRGRTPAAASRRPLRRARRPFGRWGGRRRGAPPRGPARDRDGVIKMLGDPAFAEDPALLERWPRSIFAPRVVLAPRAPEVAFEENEQDGQEPPSEANGAGETLNGGGRR